MYERITIDNYQEEFVNNADADFVLIDVREEDEFAAGHLPGAVNLPLSELQFRMDEVDEDKAVVLVCRTNNRSEMAAQILTANGYDNLYQLVEGTASWMRRGLPLEIPE
jgi:rhodanese-related sulfurtransferase